MQGDGSEKMTKEKMDAARRKEMMDHYVRTFARQTIGVHGQELPKFADSLEEYWKLSDGYCESPRVRSATLLKQLQRHWAKLDLLRLADVRDVPAPPDPFKSTHVPQKPKNTAVAVKVQELNLFGDEESDRNPGPRFTSPRWSEMQKPLQKPHEQNSALREWEERFERRPLPSSFSANGIFQDPLDLIKQHRKGLKTAAPGTGRPDNGKPLTKFKLQKNSLLSMFTSKKASKDSKRSARMTVSVSLTNRQALE